MSKHELVIRGGTVVDGSGGEPISADVAIDDGVISAVAPGLGAGKREIDARDHLVTPGFVDVHTHYDGQVTWDPELSPSSWHGCTTVVMGNCGVGFAPVKRGTEQWLIDLMDGVEDIPGSALAEGLAWDWESFPEYMDAVARLPRAIDVGLQVPHGPVRAYVMGEERATREAASEADVAAMRAIVADGLRAGALGFSTSRTLLHRSLSGELVPGTDADEAEIMGLGRAIADAGHGVFEMVSDRPDIYGWVARLSIEHGVRVTALLQQTDRQPDGYRVALEGLSRMNAAGARVVAQVSGRTTGMLLCLDGALHPFVGRPSYEAIAGLPRAERAARMAQPDVRSAILAELPLPGAGRYAGMDNVVLGVTARLPKAFRMGDPPDYEPPPEQSLGAIARREGRDVLELAYDTMLEDSGRGVIYMPVFNYSHQNLDAAREMMLHPHATLGLSDGGAHCGVICDVSMPTFMLTHWARDRSRGERLPLQQVVAMQTRQSAALYGLEDRGVLAPGMKGDVNVIDFDRLALERPEVAHDLPAGGRRLVQRARGYRATVVSGEIVREHDAPTGARPGRLIRGPQQPRA